MCHRPKASVLLRGPLSTAHPEQFLSRIPAQLGRGAEKVARLTILAVICVATGDLNLLAATASLLRMNLQRAMSRLMENQALLSHFHNYYQNARHSITNALCRHFVSAIPFLLLMV